MIVLSLIFEPGIVNNMKCRNCQNLLDFVLIDLGNAPLSNAYLTEISLRRPEKWFPLRVLVCEKCWLVQAESYSRAAEIFNDEYAYFSSFSTAWLEHAKTFCDFAVREFKLDKSSFVIEVASNDGYLLKNFIRAGIPCLGIEPTASTASAARAQGVKTLEVFFGEKTALRIVQEYGHADLWVGNNVLAHVPDIEDFLKGVHITLKDTGTATFEVHNLVNLIKHSQFDTIYHEHFSYYTFTSVYNLLERNSLRVTKVEDLLTHGGSLRIFVQKTEVASNDVHSSVADLLSEEMREGIRNLDFYRNFSVHAIQVKNDFLSFLLECQRKDKIVVGYGAAAKGNTLLNFAGVKPDLIPFVVDRNDEKVGKFLPGSRIPIVEESALSIRKPDYIVIFPWNIKAEIESQLSYTREWGAKFVTAVPRLEIW